MLAQSASAEPGTIAAAAVTSFDLGADVSLSEGDNFARSIVVSDEIDDGGPGWDYIVDYGDGTGPITAHADTRTIELQHQYVDGPASFTLSLTVTDGPGESATDTLPVHVANVAPTPMVTGTGVTTEGTPYSLLLEATDPAGANDPIFFAIDWADGFSSQVLRPPGIVTHVYQDDPDGPSNTGARSILVSAYDGDDLTSVSVIISIHNTAPVIALGGSPTAETDVPYTLTLGAITDPGRDVVTSRTINWGDGVSETVSAGGTFTHTYTVAGPKEVSVDLVDEDGVWTQAGVLLVDVLSTNPTAPSALTATAVDRRTVRLDWTNTTVDQSSIQIEQCKGTGCTSFARAAIVSGTATTFSFGRLTPGTTYRFRIRARNEAGFSRYTSIVTVRTKN